jgi:hypothetical protein
VIS